MAHQIILEIPEGKEEHLHHRLQQIAERNPDHVKMPTTSSPGVVKPPEAGGLTMHVVPNLTNHEVYVTVVENPLQIPIEEIAEKLKADIADSFARYL